LKEKVSKLEQDLSKKPATESREVKEEKKEKDERESNHKENILLRGQLELRETELEQLKKENKRIRTRNNSFNINI